MEDKLWLGLEIMGKGMLGIFLVIVIIMVFVWGLKKIFKVKK